MNPRWIPSCNITLTRFSETTSDLEVKVTEIQWDFQYSFYSWGVKKKKEDWKRLTTCFDNITTFFFHHIHFNVSFKQTFWKDVPFLVCCLDTIQYIQFFATTTTSLSPWENLHILMKWAHVSCQYEQQCQLLTKALFFLNLKSDQITPPSFHVHRCIHPRFKLPLRILQSVNMWVEYRNSTFYYSTTIKC